MMRQAHIFLYTISLFLLFGKFASAQEQHQEDKKVQQQDTLLYPDQYGLRVGVNLSKPIRSLIDENYSGVEILGDFRIAKNYYLAAELGNEKYIFDAPNLKMTSKGSYFKVGANYNAYNNWMGMENSIFVGLRYGFATFQETLDEYTIYSSSAYFEPDVRTINETYKDLTASWIEFQFGVKTEVLNHLYLGIHVELKRRLSQKTPPYIDSNVYIPGFQRTYDRSKFGAGWGYSITYMIPFFKKK